MSTNYEFTTNWFEYQKSVIERFILPSSKEYHFLEIGSYEGMSTVYYIDNYLENPNSTITTIDPFNISDTCSKKRFRTASPTHPLWLSKGNRTDQSPALFGRTVLCCAVHHKRQTEFGT